LVGYKGREKLLGTGGRSFSSDIKCWLFMGFSP
jgi:hypothetical protein